MTEDGMKRFDLFEAVVFALYGNWLISLLTDKISFTRYPVGFNVFGIWYQEVCVGLAFACLLILFAFSIFKPNVVSKKFLFIVYSGHVIGIYCAFFVEGFSKANLVFYSIGLILFWITFVIELKRIKISRRDTQINPPTT
jgi:hypothetical protein